MNNRSQRAGLRTITQRAGRWVALAATLPALWACTSNRLVEPVPDISASPTGFYQASVNRNLDIVFMIDDSSSMTRLQNKLTASFPEFMNVLKAIPGGLPNVHIGVVSSSMGAGRNPAVDHCPQYGDRGVFHSKPVGATCAKGSLKPGQTFLTNIGGVANYTGDIADAFGCIAALGDGGCGFEHQLGSVLRALGADGAPPPVENAGFLRADAQLAIILITNEDDCSAPAGSELFDSSSALVSDPLGPLQSYRCNEFGHTCGGHAPPRTPAGPRDLTGTCTSAEDGRLLRIADVVAALKTLKADPHKISVAAIAGPPNPYVVELVPPSLKDVAQWPAVDHSCTAVETDGSVTYGDPSVRIAQWVQAFGSNSVFESICGDTFKDALQNIAKGITADIEPPCIHGRILDRTDALWTGATTPDCAVVDHGVNDKGDPVDVALPACPPGQTTGPTPCWWLDGQSNACTDGAVIQFNRPGAPAQVDLNSTVSCSVLVCPTKGTPGAPPGC